MSSFCEHDEWMARALDLARRGEGLTRPNPPVGAVVVRNGRLIAQGWHRKAGGAHAEILALRRAGTDARGATLYVTLEPCSTFGRTPPCTDAIIAAGVSRVVAAMRDPNPRHRGRGFALLRRAGIEVVVGSGASEARDLLAPFAHHLATGRPWLTLKLGMSLDGRLADYTGRSKWITCPAARREVQKLRRAADAILIGSGTALADDPSLLPRPAAGRKPLRVVADARGRTPDFAQVLRGERPSETILATTRQCPKASRLAWSRAGARVWVLPAVKRGVSMRALLERLGAEGVLHVLCEGGGELAASLVSDNLANNFFFFLAPIILGGSGRPAFAGAWPLSAAPRLAWMNCRRVDSDFVLSARPKRGPLSRSAGEG